MPLKDDWVDGNSYTAVAANAVATQVNTNTAVIAGKATPADITSAITALKGTAGSALDTLGELSDALGDDANYAAAVTTALAGKQPLNTALKEYAVDLYAGADDDAKIAAALTAMGNNPGTLVLGARTYNTTATILFDRPGQGMRGQGVGATTINFTGTGDCIRQWDSTVPTNGSTGPGKASPMTGFLVNGWSNANSNICGIHIGDLNQIYIDDVYIQGFTTSGSKGVWGENLYSWSERAYIQVDTEECKDSFVFEGNVSHPNPTTSWSYSTFLLSVSAQPNENGLTIRNDCVLWGANLKMWGNYYGAATNTSVVLTVGSGGSDGSGLTGNLTIVSETIGGGAVGPKDINVGAAARIRGAGVLEFTPFAASFVAGTATPDTVQFAGRVQCPSIGGLDGEGLRIVGNTRFHNTTGGENHLNISDAVAGNYPEIAASTSGADTNIGIVLSPKGTGPVRQWVNSQTSATWGVAGSQTNIDQNITTKGTGVVKANGVQVRTVTPRVNPMSFSATPTFDLGGAYDQFNMTLTGAITSATFSNGVDGASYRFRFKDNATSRAIALGSTARAVGITIPAATVVSKVLYLVGIWNAADTKIDIVGVAQEA
jgi:hypothetical protein